MLARDCVMRMSTQLFGGGKRFIPASLFRRNNLSTAEGRAMERQSRATLTAAAAALAKIISIGTGLVTIPLTLSYLGSERYGMWMTMSSLVGMLGFADLGIGNGILNAVATASGKGSTVEIREYVSSGIFVLVAIAVCILGVFALFYGAVPWFALFNVESNVAKAESGPALAVLVACITLAIPTGVVQRVQMGLQSGFVANLWQCLGSVLALCGVCVVIRLHAGLAWLVLAYVGSPQIAAILNGMLFFGVLRRDLAPAPRFVSRRAIEFIVQTGVLFLVLQIASSITFASDNIIIAQLLGAGAVAEYSVPQKMFSLIPTIIMMVLMPLWPAYGEAIARGDQAWVKKTLSRSVYLTFVASGVISLAMISFGKQVISLWVGNAIMPSFWLLLALGIWQVIQASGNSVAMFLNGANVIRFQVIVASVTTIAALIAKIFLVRAMGGVGVVVGIILAYSLLTLTPYYFYLRNRFRRAESRAVH